MNRADALYLDGYRAALAVARTAADRIVTGPMHSLRREMAAEALRSFADEAEAAIGVVETTPTPSDVCENFSPASDCRAAEASS